MNNYNMCLLYTLTYIAFIRCGPLSRFWCMRFESKHNYFKNLAHRVGCFKKTFPKPLPIITKDRLVCTSNLLLEMAYIRILLLVQVNENTVSCAICYLVSCW